MQNENILTYTLQAGDAKRPLAAAALMSFIAKDLQDNGKYCEEYMADMLLDISMKIEVALRFEETK